VDFLARLLDLLFPPRDGELIARSAREADLRACLEPSLTERCEPRAIALSRFRTPLMRALVHEAKFRDSSRAQDLLAVMLAGYLAEYRAARSDKEDSDDPNNVEAGIALVPIPLSRSRLRERGFNQCEVIARKALQRLDATARDAIVLSPQMLSRVRDTEHQTALTRAGRRANVRGAFRAAGVIDPARTYIVLDDVITTGATLQEAVDALKGAGAVRILPLALAH
jgi:ComF family protein